MSTQNEALQISPAGRWIRRGVGCLFVLALLPLLYYGLYFVLRRPPAPNPQFIAHRGGPAHAPENTLAAFQHAISLGVDWLEFDVQMTKDEVLVVIHDETVTRTMKCPAGREDCLAWPPEVGKLTLEQIRTFEAKDGHGEQVPTFEEVLALAKQAAVGVMPEVKSPHLYQDLEAEMVQAIEEAAYVDQTMLQSFAPQSLDAIHALNPNLQLCPLYKWRLSLGGPQPGQANTVCPMAEVVLLYPWMLKQAHDEGRQVFVWFGAIEQPLVMRFMLALGADGLMVDNPEALADILGK